MLVEETAPTKTSDEIRRDRRNEVAEENKGVGKLAPVTATIARLLLSVSREQAVLKSILVQCLLLPTKGTRIFAEVKLVTTACNAETSELTQAQKQSRPSPHLLVWNVFLQVYKDLPEVVAHLAEIEKLAAEMIEEKTAAALAPFSPPEIETMKINFRIAQLSQTMFVARCIKCWDPERCRVELCAKQGTLTSVAVEAVLSHMEMHQAGERRRGQAPTGKLERVIENWLSKQGGGKGRGGKGKGSEDVAEDLMQAMAQS